MTDYVKCPHCGEVTHIGGLIGENTNDCPRCGSNAWDWANIGISEAKQCTDCGEIFFGGSFGKPWVEITKEQIDDCLKHSDNYDFAWAIEALCKKNNGY